MLTIWKFPFEINDDVEIEMPMGKTQGSEAVVESVVVDTVFSKKASILADSTAHFKDFLSLAFFEKPKSELINGAAPLLIDGLEGFPSPRSEWNAVGGDGVGVPITPEFFLALLLADVNLGVGMAHWID